MDADEAEGPCHSDRNPQVDQYALERLRAFVAPMDQLPVHADRMSEQGRHVGRDGEYGYGRNRCREECAADEREEAHVDPKRLGGAQTTRP